MGNKPVLGCVISSHTIFSFFEFFLPTRSLNKLHVNTNFMILGVTVQKLWVFEVFRSLGRAGMCWNQPSRVDHLPKKWKAGEKKIQKKRDNLALSRRRPAAGGRPLVAGQP
jgi:hypothetical protein